MATEHTISDASRATPHVVGPEGPDHILDGKRELEFERLAAAYSWDMRIDEAKRWPYRLMRRIMDIGTLDDIVSMEKSFGPDELIEALATAEAGALRPKSWTFWHYRLGLVPPGATCPPMPARRAA